MNKYLTGLVVTTTIATIGGTSIPALAETVQDLANVESTTADSTTPAAATVGNNSTTPGAVIIPEDEIYANLDNDLNTIFKAVGNLSLTNSASADDITNCAKSVINDANINVEVVDFQIALPATETTLGKINYKIKLTDISSGLYKASEMKDKSIDTKDIAKLRSIISAYVVKITPSNNIKEDDILAGIKEAINDENIQLSIGYFGLEKATIDKNGYCYFGVNAYDTNNNQLWLDYTINNIIYTSAPTPGTNPSDSNTPGNTNPTPGTNPSDSNIPGNTNPSTGTKPSDSNVPGNTNPTTGTYPSSGSSSSSHHKSKSSTSSSAGTTSTSTSATGTSSGAAAAITKVISLSNMSKEAIKAVEAKVVSNITAAIGTGAVAGQAKEVSTADGAKLAVTTITKDDKSAGAVITAEVSSAKVIIPIVKGQAPVAAVYKYVPLLGKYIQVQDAVITEDTVALSVQANATYVTSPIVMEAADTIKEGWVNADNNWYKVNAAGDPLTGWQKDNTGWTYMSPTTGAMQTGWAQYGRGWYYLNRNGYMATGWVKDGANWYYCNSDGSMSANTIVDGYKLGANGAWIR